MNAFPVPVEVPLSTAATKKLIPCALELGEKSANIVFEDINLNAAINGIVFSTVWVKTYRFASYLMPFRGFMQSGIERENGADAIKKYLQQKSLHINMNPAQRADPCIRR